MLTWLLRPIVLKALGVLACIICIGLVVHGIWQAGYNSAWRKAERNTLLVKIATLERDQAIRKEALEDADKKQVELKDIVDAYQVQLSAAMDRAGDTRLADQRDIDELRVIRRIGQQGSVTKKPR